MKAKICFLVLVFFTITIITNGQISLNNSDDIVKSTDFSIPSSPAFSLLEMNPEIVNRPGFLKDFKADWVMSDNSLKPNIAIEAQPIWLFFYDDVNLTEYQSKGWFDRTISTLSISLATAEKDSVNAFAYSVKLNLFHEKNSDPMMNDELIAKIKPVFDEKEKELLKQKVGLEDELNDEVTSTERKAEIVLEIEKIDALINLLDSKEKEMIEKAKKEFANKYWNASMLDIGFGQLFNYQSAKFDSLDFVNQGKAIWVNGACRLGKNALLTGLYKQFIFAENHDYLLGLNFKFGNSKINFFAEGVYENISKEDQFTIGYGGDFRFNQNIKVQFGLRTEYNKDFKLNDIIPLININWVMKN